MGHLLPPGFGEAAAGWAAFVQANADWATVILFAVAFVETLVLIGLLLPTALMLMAVGALVAAGAFGLWEAIAAVALGGAAGSAASYWLGRLLGDRVHRIWPFSRRPELLARGHAFFERHGGKSIFLSQFFGPLRAVIPVTAGMLAMPHRRFQAVNLVSALMWSSLLVYSGMTAGTGLGLARPAAVPGDASPIPSAAPPAPGPGGCAVAPPLAGEPPRAGCGG
jgi:membrane protein DedA with SNARE-associated domain